MIEGRIELKYHYGRCYKKITSFDVINIPLGTVVICIMTITDQGPIFYLCIGKIFANMRRHDIKFRMDLWPVYQIIRYCISLLLVWPSEAIGWHRSGSTLDQVMACCLMATSQYLNQSWLIIMGFCGTQLTNTNFTRCAQDIYSLNESE